MTLARPAGRVGPVEEIDRLVGKGLEKIDLMRRKRANLGAPDDNHSNRIARASKGNCECRSKAKASGSLAALWVLGHFGRQVGNLNLTPLEHGASEEHPTH